MSGVLWIFNLFSEQAVTKVELSPRLYDQLIEISSDQSAKLTLNNDSFDNFVMGIKKEFPKLSTNNMAIFDAICCYILQLRTSIFHYGESRNSLTLENDTVLCVTILILDI